ncbi:DUF87 domain-containing protein [Staphylococcus saprophyticus]|nr:DUF87 domain-containing protein [Staphylococcus saprophyticus]
MLNIFKRNKAVKNDDEITLEDSLNEANNALLSRIAPDSIQERQDNVQFGDNYTKTFVVTNLKTTIRAEDLRNISELSDNINISYFYSEIDDSEIKKGLSKSIEENEMKRDSPNNKAHRKEEAKSQIASATKTLQQLTSRETTMYDLQIIIGIVASSEQELQSLTSRVMTNLSMLGSIIYPRLRSKEAFDSNLPLANNKLKDLSSNTISSKALSYFFPFHENEIIMNHGVIVGKNRSTGNIVKVDPEVLLNKHMFVVGISGSGKSTYLFADMMRKKSLGTDVLVIDPKGEFGRPFKARGGSWFKFSTKEGGNMLNMFDVPNQSIKVDDMGEYKEIINPLRDHITSLMVSFRLMYPAMDLDTSNELTEVLIELYRNFNMDVDDDTLDYSKFDSKDYPILSDLANLIDSYQETDLPRYERLSSFRKGIQKYVTGLYKYVLNGHTNIDTNDRSLVAFDVSEVTEIDDLNKVVYYNVLTYIKKIILNGDGRSTQVYVDEAHYIADPDVPIAMKNLFIMMKVFRSLNTGVTPATQSITDFLSAEDKKRNYGEAVIDQAVQRLFLPMQEKEVESVNNQLNLKLTEDDKEFLKVREGERSKESGKGFFYVGSKKVKLEVILTQLESEIWFEKNYEKLQ